MKEWVFTQSMILDACFRIPWEFVKMHIPGFESNPIESEYLWVWLRNLRLKKKNLFQLCSLKCRNDQVRQWKVSGRELRGAQISESNNHGMSALAQ